MSLFEEVVPAEYGGVSFLVTRSRIEGGRKDSLKEFPNSDKQLVEDLGLKVRSYALECIINADREGENYIKRRDAFLQVLEAGERKVLVHPLYGSIGNVVVRTYSLTEDFTGLGEAKFSVAFAVSNIDGVPVISGDTVSQVSEAASAAIQAINSDVANNFRVSNLFPSNFTAAVDKVGEVVDSFISNTSFLQVTTDSINEFSAEVGELSANVTQLISNPQGLADSITGLFGTVNGLYSSVDNTFEVIQRFFDFGDNDVAIIQDTATKIERARNNSLLNNMIKAEALVLNYSNASQIEYSTVTQVQTVATTLEDQYQDIIVSSIRGIVFDPQEPEVLPNAFQSETLDTITNLRIIVQEFFNDQKLSVSQVLSVRTPQTPSRVLSYQYYGNSDLGEDIANLNEDLNVSFIEGEVEVFTE